MPNFGQLAAQLGYPETDVRRAWDASFGRQGGTSGMTTPTGKAAQPDLYGQRGDIYGQYGAEVSDAYSEGSDPYEASTMDKIIKAAGIAALFGGLASGGGGKYAGALGATAGMGLAHGRGKEARFNAERDRKRGDRLAMADVKMRTDLGRNEAAMGQQGAGIAAEQTAYDREQARMDREYRERERPTESGLSYPEYQRDRDYYYKVEKDAGEAAAAATTGPARENLLAHTAATDPDWWDQTALAKGAKVTPDQIREAYRGGELGMTEPEGPGFFEDPLQWVGEGILGQVGMEPSREPISDPMARSRYGDLLHGVDQAQADSAQYHNRYVAGATGQPFKQERQTVPNRWGDMQGPQRPGNVQPPPNDGTLTDAQYAEWVDLWRRGLVE